MSTDPMKERLNAGNSTLKLLPSSDKSKTRTLKESKSFTWESFHYSTAEEYIVEVAHWNMASNICQWCIKTPRVSLSDLTDIKHSSLVESVGKLVRQTQQLNWLMSMFEHHCWSVGVCGSWLPTLVYLFLYLTSRVIYEVKRITPFFLTLTDLETIPGALL